MKKIASFTVNHDILEAGMYISRVDGDVITYDVRMKKPNKGDYIPAAAAHTIEHLFATYARNTKECDDIIYVGPMGCLTGFYFLTRSRVTHERAIEIVSESMEYIASFNGVIPGSTARECGNYLFHDLPTAQKIAYGMVEVLKNYTPEMLIYK